MDFTQIRELDRLIGNSGPNGTGAIAELEENDFELKDLRATHYISVTESRIGQIEQLMKEIDMFAQSMMNVSAQQLEQDLLFRTKAQTEYQAPSSVMEMGQDQQLLFLPKRKEAPRASINGRNSVMFRASLAKNPYLKKQKRIKVFYFGNPVFRLVNYTNQTTVEDLIDKAIFAYLEDPTLDKHRIKSTKASGKQLVYSAYVLRILDDDSGYKADPELEPLDMHRLVSDMGFQSLVMLANNSIQVEFNEKDESLISSSPTRANMLMIRVYDQKSEELLTRTFHKNEKVDVVLHHIQQTGKYVIGKYYLTEALDDELEVDSETALGTLDNKKLYVMLRINQIKLRKFADDPIEEEPKIPEESPSKQKMAKGKETKHVDEGKKLQEQFHPLSETQASNYEQFQVVKVNTRGARQNRVIGIDQTKLYNYDQEVHNNTKQVSLFSKIFGKSSAFGTKRPERLIKDIISVKDVPERGCLLIECRDEEKSKVLQFEAEPSIRFKIIQKLSYLMELQQRPPY